MADSATARPCRERPTGGEVWVAAVRMIARTMQGSGLELAPLCEGLGLSPADCEAGVKRIDWETFVVLLDRCVDACGGMTAFEAVLFRELRSRPARMPIFGLCASPKGLYLDMVPWLFTHGLQSLDFAARELAEGRFQWSCRIRQGYSSSEAAMRSVCALARELTGLLELPPAQVEARWTDRDCQCLILLPLSGHAQSAHPAQARNLVPSPLSLVNPKGAHRIRAGTRNWGLSPREAEVLNLVATGRQNKEIASVLGVSIKTVEKHLSNVMWKAGVRNRTELLSELL